MSVCENATLCLCVCLCVCVCVGACGKHLSGMQQVIRKSVFSPFICTDRNLSFLFWGCEDVKRFSAPSLSSSFPPLHHSPSSARPKLLKLPASSCCYEPRGFYAAL